VKLRTAIESSDALGRLSDLRAWLAPWRREVVDHVARNVLGETIARNPVDTGRSRSAWVAGLEHLGGIAPPGWHGDTPNTAAIAEGAAAADVAQPESRHASEAIVTSGVEYVRYLEYGTRSMSPFAMVGRSLADASRHLVGALGRLLAPRG
jgi:hypothetical protein